MQLGRLALVMIADAHHAAPARDRSQDVLSVEQGAGPQIPAFQVQQVEGVVGQRGITPSFQRRLQRREARHAVGPECDQLAVQHRRVQPKGGNPSAHRRQPIGPV